MRTIRRVVNVLIAATLVVPALLLSPLGAGAAVTLSAQDTTAPSLVSISFSPPSVTVSGTNTVPVTIRVRLTDDTGVVEAQRSNGDQTPTINVEGIDVPHDTGDGGYFGLPPLTLTSGTAKDGIWSTVVNIPSTDNGVHHVTSVEADDAAGNQLTVDPRTTGIDPTLSVVGHNQPRVSMGFSPDPVLGNGPATVAVKGRAIYSDTGRPIAGLRMAAANNFVDGGGCDVGLQVVTNSRGYYSITRPYQHATFYLSGELGGTLVICQSKSPRVRFLVGAAVARTPIRLGKSVEIRDNVAPTTGGRMGPVYLQRLVSGKWRTVNHAAVRSSGRYALTATPSTVGNHRYRVSKPGSTDGHSIANVSRTVLVGVRS